MILHDTLKAKVAEWQSNSYKSDYPAISEILDFNFDSETQSLCYLRKAHVVLQSSPNLARFTTDSG
jgi:hypothetical protein